MTPPPPPPPRVATWLLRWLLQRGAVGHSIVGDLVEEYTQRRPGVRRTIWFALVATELALQSIWTRLARRRRRNGWGITHVARGVLQDVQLAARLWFKRPAFAFTVVLTLVIGLGANTAIFSIVNTVLLDPLPFPAPERLVTLWERNIEQGQQESWVAPPTFEDWQEQNEAFVGMAAFSSGGHVLTGGKVPQRVGGVSVSPTFFEVLGNRMDLGGSFSEGDVDAGVRPVVISHQFWNTWFGRDPQVVGASVVLDDRSHTVAGVLPADFRFPFNGDVWTPLVFSPEMLSEGMRGARYLHVVARLDQSVTPRLAEADMAAISQRLGAIHPNNAGWDVTVLGLHELMVRDFRAGLLLLYLAVLIVLLIVCANVANLAVARASERRRDTALRRALGASELQLLRQIFVENVMLTLVAGVVAVLVAQWAIGPLTQLAPAALPRIGDVGLSGAVAAVCAGLALLVAVAVTGVQWLQLRRVRDESVHSMGNVRVAGGSSQGVRRTLIVLEVASSVVLLVGAGLLLRSFAQLSNIDPGFDIRDRSVVSLSLPQSRYPSATEQATFYERLLSGLASVDAIHLAGVTTNLPLSGSSMRFGFSIDGRQAPEGERLVAQYHATGPGYFSTMGIPVRGRSFQLADTHGAEPIVMVNEFMARQYWPESDPIGQTVTVISRTGPNRRRVVGVVPSIRHHGLTAPEVPEVYVPLAQDPWAFATVVVQSDLDAPALTALIQSQVAIIDPTLPLNLLQPMADVLNRWLVPMRFQLVLIGLFGLTALLLSAIGIYGVMSYLVNLRRTEIGIRLALGASTGSVFRTVVGQGVTMAAVGVGVGVLAAAFGTRFLEGFLYGVSVLDPATFLSIPILLLVVAGFAAFLPARRAMLSDPVEVLRSD